MNYKIISSGSQGNAIIIDDILFDCGVPFAKLNQHLKDIKYIFITHTHSDHLNISTIKRIMAKYPWIKVLGNYEVYEEVGYLNKIITTKPFILGKWIAEPFECVHDVLTHGIILTHQDNGISLIYATDTNNLDMVDKDRKFDYMFIESNHCEKLIEQARNKTKEYGYNVFLNAKRHLSKQQSELFYYLHRKNKNSKWVELHKSKRFYV